MPILRKWIPKVLILEMMVIGILALGVLIQEVFVSIEGTWLEIRVGADCNDVKSICIDQNLEVGGNRLEI